MVSLTKSVLSRESISYANEIHDWWGTIEGRAQQTADVWKNTPEMTYDEALKMLLALTELELNTKNQSIEDVANAATQLADTASGLTENSIRVRELCMDTVKSSEEGKAETVNEITGITSAINEISSQTNLLSLNASIEASRAGEMGRGFAVVAGEVGALASQSSMATENISKLIESITRNIEEINKKADNCILDMEKCLSGVNRTSASFDTVYEDITKAADGITDIFI